MGCKFNTYVAIIATSEFMNIIDILRFSHRSMEEEYRSIASQLQEFGLTEYESRAYISLVAMEQASAEEMAETSAIPRTSAYKVLQSLVTKGYARSLEGRPTIYLPAEPGDIKHWIMGRVEGTFNKLQEIRGILSERGTPQLVYTVVGKERVLAKIGSMIESCSRRLIVSTPVMRMIRQDHESRFEHAMSRGVEVIVVAEPFVKLPPCTKCHRKSGLMATDVVSDGEVALIASPDLSLCGYTDNEFLAIHIESFVMTTLERLEE